MKTIFVIPEKEDTLQVVFAKIIASLHKIGTKPGDSFYLRGCVDDGKSTSVLSECKSVEVVAVGVKPDYTLVMFEGIVGDNEESESFRKEVGDILPEEAKPLVEKGAITYKMIGVMDYHDLHIGVPANDFPKKTHQDYVVGAMTDVRNQLVECALKVLPRGEARQRAIYHANKFLDAAIEASGDSVRTFSTPSEISKAYFMANATIIDNDPEAEE